MAAGARLATAAGDERMALDDGVGNDARALHWLAERLLELRVPFAIVFVLVTALFALWAFQLRLDANVDDLLPKDHAYVGIHDRFSDAFGGADSLVVMLEVRDGTIFTPRTLNTLWRMTAALETVHGVHHDQIESIAHRAARYVKAGAGGTLRSQPLMTGEVATQEEADEIRRNVHNAENLHGLFVSRDDTAALIRADFIAGPLDYRRIFDEVNDRVVDPFRAEGTGIFVAGTPRLYGWVSHHAGDVLLIVGFVAGIEWLLLWAYFRDWRATLRPTISALVGAFWGLGFIHAMGLALDPLMLVIPFAITAHALSHSIHMHERYYEALERCGWDQRRALVASFAERCAPALSGISSAAFAALVMLLVPVSALQTLAVAAAFWILAIGAAELIVNPIVYSYVAAPDPVRIIARRADLFRRVVRAFGDRLLTRAGMVVTLLAWLAAAGAALSVLPRLTVGDPTSASPLLIADSPYNLAHRRILRIFGGIEPLIIVAEGYDPDAMKQPQVLRRMEQLQRAVGRDPAVGASRSLADIIRTVNMVFHELEPKWGVIPNSWVDVGGLFFIYFAGATPEETAQYVDPTYTAAPVTFFCTDHKGENIRRIIDRARQFVAGAQMEDLGLTVEARDGKVVVASRSPDVHWEQADRSWVAVGRPTGQSPFRVGDVIARVGETEVSGLDGLSTAVQAESLNAPRLDFTLLRDGRVVTESVTTPWRATFKLAGGVIGTLAAANQTLLANTVLVVALGLVALWAMLAFTYKSVVAALYVLVPLATANLIAYAAIAVSGIGIHIHTLPFLAVALAVGIDHGIYIVGRTIEAMRVRGDLREALREALDTSGRTAVFAAFAIAMGSAYWAVSPIRFNADMGLLLALWVVVSAVAAQTLMPVLILLFTPRFIMREAREPRPA
jgi:predicted RND superfamily exporter protein